MRLVSLSSFDGLLVEIGHPSVRFEMAPRCRLDLQSLENSEWAKLFASFSAVLKDGDDEPYLIEYSCQIGNYHEREEPGTLDKGRELVETFTEACQKKGRHPRDGKIEVF